MAITKTTVNDKIEVMNHGAWSSVRVRTAIILSEDGQEISRTFHRHVVMPDADLSQQDADVSLICTPVFTDEVKAAYATAQEEQ